MQSEVDTLLFLFIEETQMGISNLRRRIPVEESLESGYHRLVISDDSRTECHQVGVLLYNEVRSVNPDCIILHSIDMSVS